MNIKALALILTIITCLKLSAHELSSDEIIHLILQRAPRAVTKIEKDKVYLDCSRISLQNDRIALQDDANGFIPLIAVRSGEYGVYAKTSEFDIFGMWKCQVQGCWHWNSNSVNVCQNCHTPRGGIPE